ncbi:hypothetical protein NPIL_606081 [Nephila pilipes]|uniref:Spider venom protein n=1 Tax=Nephila pilipes TaxID=299642 RepID=A0A8X6JS99_NEPPI|nr:hypothetical protein NPIL_606081 [Nephila pilipes]
MNKIILFSFIALLVVQSDQLEDPSRCTFSGKKCARGQFCYIRYKLFKIKEYCYNYKKIGSYCDGEAHRCAPGLECRPKKIGWYMKRFCQEAPKKSATESPTLVTMSPTSTMPIDISTEALTTNSVFISTNESPTLVTMSTEKSTMPIDITTEALTTNSVFKSATESPILGTTSTETSTMPFNITTVEFTTNSGLTSPKKCRQWCTQICS